MCVYIGLHTHTHTHTSYNTDHQEDSPALHSYTYTQEDLHELEITHSPSESVHHHGASG